MNKQKLNIYDLLNHVGQNITCKIKSKQINDAKLQFEYYIGKYWNEHRFYICQNIFRGFPCDDILGYKNSWVFNFYIRSGQIKIYDPYSSFKTDHIDNFKLIEK